jgi:hypothetical protein
MSMLALILLAASAPLAAPAAAAAQSSATGPDPVVTGQNRVICRRITRTATRMRVGRICRSQSQWAADTGRAVDPNDPNATIDGAADTLDVLSQEVGTGDGKSPMDTTPDTPLGPR